MVHAEYLDFLDLSDRHYLEQGDSSQVGSATAKTYEVGLSKVA